MKYLISNFSLITVLMFSACSSSASEAENSDYPIDKKATTETIALYQNLKKLAKTNVLYGHQDDLAYGYSWWAESGRSDVKESTGSYPAVYGWELGNLRQETEVNLDGVNFVQMKIWIQEG